MIFNLSSNQLLKKLLLKWLYKLILITLSLTPYFTFSHNEEIEAESFNPIIESPLPEAPPLLNKLLSALPEEPLAGSGTIKTYEKEKKFSAKFEFKLQIKGIKRTCLYSLFDAFGDIQQQVMVVWTNNARPEVMVRNHKDSHFTRDINYNTSTIGDTDLRWNDLSLDFLYWQNWQTIRREEFLGRKCIVLKNEKDDVCFFLWIDDSWLVPLQWQEFSTKNQTPLRSIAVKSFKKIKDVWMVKDVEIYNYLIDRKTIVLFENLQVE